MDTLYAFSQAEMPQDATPLEQSYLATATIGIEAATMITQYTVASTHCSAIAMGDSNVREQCNALAELLVAKGTTLLDLGWAFILGREPAGHRSELAG
jgi:hypothetical protein